MRENPFFNLFPLPPAAPLRTRPPYLSLSSRGAASPSLLPTLSLSLCLSVSPCLSSLFLLFAFSLFLRHSIVGGPTELLQASARGRSSFPERECISTCRANISCLRILSLRRISSRRKHVEEPMVPYTVRQPRICLRLQLQGTRDLIAA